MKDSYKEQPRSPLVSHGASPALRACFGEPTDPHERVQLDRIADQPSCTSPSSTDTLPVCMASTGYRWLWEWTRSQRRVADVLEIGRGAWAAAVHDQCAQLSIDLWMGWVRQGRWASVLLPWSTVCTWRVFLESCPDELEGAPSFCEGNIDH